jgi:hypothetical protein
LEIANPGNEDVALHSFWDGRSYPYDNEDFFGNLAGKTIEAGMTKVIVRATTNDGRTLDDFLAEWVPLPRAQVITVDAPDWWQWPALNNDGDTLYLFAASGDLLDVVDYDDRSPWPSDDGEASIYLREGHISTLDNDSGGNWLLSRPGVDAAYESVETPGDPDDSDVGSPGFLPGIGPVFAPADFDHDLDVDLADYELFEQCATGPAIEYTADALPPACLLLPDSNEILPADFDQDRDVDQEDFGVFQKCYSGEGEFAEPSCAD